MPAFKTHSIFTQTHLLSLIFQILYSFCIAYRTHIFNSLQIIHFFHSPHQFQCRAWGCRHVVYVHWMILEVESIQLLAGPVALTGLEWPTWNPDKRQHEIWECEDCKEPNAIPTQWIFLSCGYLTSLCDGMSVWNKWLITNGLKVERDWDSADSVFSIYVSETLILGLWIR